MLVVCNKTAPDDAGTKNMIHNVYPLLFPTFIAFLQQQIPAAKEPELDF